MEEKKDEGVVRVDPTAEHRWLAWLAGDWNFESGEAGSEVKWSGTESGRMIGDVWLVLEGVAPALGGGEARSMSTLGFNPQVGRFVGSWIGSMMTHFWVCEGELSEDGTTLSLESDGPSMRDDGTTARYRDEIALEGDGRRVLRASVLEGKEWRRFMTTEYRRKAQ